MFFSHVLREQKKAKNKTKQNKKKKKREREQKGLERICALNIGILSWWINLLRWAVVRRIKICVGGFDLVISLYLLTDRKKKHVLIKI